MKMLNNVRMPVFVGGVFVLGGVCGVGSAVPHCDRSAYTVRVTGSERVTQGSKENVSSKYVVFTKDVQSGQERAFENTDSTLECFFDGCKFDSSTLQSKLKAAEQAGTSVKIQTYGWRIPFLSMYENVVSVQPVEEKK